MVLQHLLKKKHIFNYKTGVGEKRAYSFKFGTVGFFSIRIQTFELIYFRFLKKAVYHKHLKRRTFFKKRKF
jgi:hypothetical protein